LSFSFLPSRIVGSPPGHFILVIPRFITLRSKKQRLAVLCTRLGIPAQTRLWPVSCFYKRMWLQSLGFIRVAYVGLLKPLAHRVAHFSIQKRYSHCNMHACMYVCDNQYLRWEMRTKFVWKAWR
jgi:hypothetical protein